MSTEITEPVAPPIAPESQSGLGDLRTRITELDDALMQLLAERQHVVKSIAHVKQDGNLPLRDMEREVSLLTRQIQKARELGLNSQYVTQIFNTVMQESVKAQRSLLLAQAKATRVAALGGEGSYSTLAAKAHFAGVENLQLTPGDSFADVLKKLRDGEVDYAVLPVENSITGAITAVFDLLIGGDVYINGEHYLRIKHALLAKPGTRLSGVKSVYGHPQALAQCGDTLTHGGYLLAYSDSSAAAIKAVHDNPAHDCAAVACADLAHDLGLMVLADNIANAQENETRFLVLAKTVKPVAENIPCKTSLLLSTLQRPGALCDVLSVFRDRGINLTRIESRPVPNEPWQELFFVDFDGNSQSEIVTVALQELARVTRFVRLLGCYPSDRLPPAQVPAAVLAQTVAVSDVKRDDKPKAKAANKNWKLVSREHKNDDTVINVQGVKIGGDEFLVMAGPCSVESQEMIEQCAAHAADCGARILRGGCFKPRSSPYAFQGHGLTALDWMAAAGRRHHMPIITEVMAPEQVEPVAKQSDILQIGARNMQNFSLLKAVGQVNRPVLLKRGLMNSIEEWLQAAEYILAAGNQQVMLCERGIRTFETATRSTLDLSAVPVVKELTHLPIIVDPSHAAGRRDLVVPLALAAKAVGAHGIIVEFHPEPEKALSDGPQALYFEQFAGMMKQLYG